MDTKFISLVTFVFAAFISWFADAKSQSSERSIAFYYSKVHSTQYLLSFERVVVDANSLSADQLNQLKRAGVEVYVYLSVGEISGTLPSALEDALLGENPAWQASIMNAENDMWRQHLTQQAQQLMASGYHGLFLDTLDSYQLALAPPAYSSQESALISLLEELQHIAPKLLFNRGFQLLDRIDFVPTAVVAESYRNGYDVANNRYYQQSEADIGWLRNQLIKAQSNGSEAIVIDYAPQNQDERIALAQQILKDGFTPYISDGLLSEYGVSIHYPIPRTVIGFYDGQLRSKQLSSCHRHLSSLIEYQGYVPKCLDIHEQALDSIDLSMVQAIVYWLPPQSISLPFVANFIDATFEDISTVFIGELPRQTQLLNRLGLSSQGRYVGQLQQAGKSLLYPAPSAGKQGAYRYQASDESITVMSQLIDANGQQGIASFKAPWGGGILSPTAIQEVAGQASRWLHDPFDVLMPLLGLAEIPVADVTTESGRRVVTIHIDGDGFPSRSWMKGKPFAGETILEQVLKRYSLPHTVSIIEAEISKDGLYPQQSAALEAIAKEIFSLENVEIASHTFSHPFFWDTESSVKEKRYGDHLPVPGYVLDYDREISGSVNYINQRLAPPGKQVKVFLWTGEANPTEAIINKTKALGLYNVNGGNTYVVYDNPSLSQVYPHLNWHPSGVQVYAPVMNENLYTNLWGENFEGYVRSIETFNILGSPRRMKPVAIYYHMYSGEYPSSLSALKQVYTWAEQQPFTPLYLSEFASRAQSLYETGIAKSIVDDYWYVASTGVRSLRVANLGSLSAESNGIAGIASGPDGQYLTLASNRARFSLQAQRQPLAFKRPLLVFANGIVEKWQHKSEHTQVQILAHQPLRLTFSAHQNCTIAALTGPSFTISQQEGFVSIQSPASGVFSFNIECDDGVEHGGFQ
ncbi:endo alpha-1,4 polygalactosaminidase [Paraferrimonas haliotis]|uniref:Glycoside-hydrolase family GH114 TIM-barrel domain-containing protein n=1 Tax=Paraferrimonas haliotis TaxID=2013866 RepID=A0AA37TM50_9GAMM|nr:endo alpha-1,4 polygalactosaminidase [Paraferrimonas haliotis]GLS84082.1 hypothetical protein GCM10007894_20590 [Paraferrimonas haliotis]